MRIPEGQTCQELIVDAAIWRVWKREAAKRNVSAVGLVRGVMRVLSEDSQLLDNVLDDDGLIGERPYAVQSLQYLSKLSEMGGKAFNGAVAREMQIDVNTAKSVAKSLRDAGYVSMEKRLNVKGPLQWHVAITDAGRAAL